MDNNSSNPIRKYRTIFQRAYQDFSSAVYKSDHELLEFAKHLNNIVALLHSIHFTRWNCPLSIQDDSLVRYRPYDFFNLNPLQKHLEMLRAEAEAKLIHNKLGYSDLAQWERTSLIQRALGILPDNITDQFIEILTCPGFRPGNELQSLYQQVERFKKGLQMIKREFGQATALAFGLLIQSGIKTYTEFEHYGQKLDIIFRKIFNLPQIQQLLDNRRYESSFETEYIFLATMRDRILKHMPHRIQDEKKFLLSDILDEDWEKSQEIHGAEVIFTALDSIVLSRFGFENNCLYTNDNLCLEVITVEKIIYWEPLTNAPITNSIPATKYRSDFLLLNALTFSKIADVYIQLGRDLEKAIGLYQKAIDLTPDFPNYYANLAQVYIKINSPKQAIPYLQKAIEINEESPECYHMLGLVNCLIYDWQSAITALRKASALRPFYIEAQNNLAYAYEQNGDFNKAEETYQQILAYKPNYFEALFGLGTINYNNKQYDQAIIYFERALKINRHSQRALYNLGQSYYQKGEMDASIIIYKELLRLNPNHASAWNNLGVIYRNKGMKKEAVKCIEQAVRFNPNLIK
jgi:tetratricopeptide (TPR) repeat protein